MPQKARALALSVCLLGVLAGARVFSQQVPSTGSGYGASTSAGHGPSPSPHVSLVDEYCLSCHDKDHEKGGLVLDDVVGHDVSQHPEVWEKVVRKLRARQMPPIGKERPGNARYDAVVASLEASLDRARMPAAPRRSAG
jgi:hypothetical protein